MHAELNQSRLIPLINVYFTLSSTDSKEHQLGHEHIHIYIYNMQIFQTAMLPANIIQTGSQWYWSLWKGKYVRRRMLKSKSMPNIYYTYPYIVGVWGRRGLGGGGWGGVLISVRAICRCYSVTVSFVFLVFCLFVLF